MPRRNLALCYPCTTNDGCEVYSCISYRTASPSDSPRLAHQEQVRGSCVSFESLGAVGSSSCRLCVYFESLRAVGSSSTRIVCFLRELGIRWINQQFAVVTMICVLSMCCFVRFRIVAKTISAYNWWYLAFPNGFRLVIQIKTHFMLKVFSDSKVCNKYLLMHFNWKWQNG